MLPILLGLVLAMLFGLMSFLVYGLDGLINYPWIDAVFWGLIATGALITLINEVVDILPGLKTGDSYGAQARH